MVAAMPSQFRLTFTTRKTSRDSKGTPVSIDGGRSPLFSADGSELYYRLDTAVMAVDLSTEGETPRVGRPRELLDGDYAVGTNTREYHLAPDGRFLMLKNPSAESTGAAATQVILVQNWFEELKRLVPTE